MFSAVLMAGLALVVGGSALWLAARTDPQRYKAVSLMVYGIALIPAPTIVMALSLLVTRNQ